MFCAPNTQLNALPHPSFSPDSAPPPPSSALQTSTSIVMNKMRVVTIEECPASKVFKCQDKPLPIPKDDEVLISVTFTGVTKLDVLRKHFEYELPPDWNSVPGLQCRGKIISVGKNVLGWKCGDEVCALLNGGGYATAAVVRAEQVLPLPFDDCIDAVACLPEAACATWEALMRLCKLSANMTLLVYERCGQICDLAVQLAEMVQAKVIIARDTSTFVKRFSAHINFDVKSPLFRDKIMENTGYIGVDVILDCDVSTLENPKYLKIGGTVVLVELFPEKMANVDLRKLFGYNGVLYVVNRMWWTPEYMAEVVLDMREKMWPKFTSGNLVLPEEIEIGRVYWLSEVAHARIGDLIIPV